jgi:hypothetical protein
MDSHIEMRLDKEGKTQQDLSVHMFLGPSSVAVFLQEWGRILYLFYKKVVIIILFLLVE